MSKTRRTEAEARELSLRARLLLMRLERNHYRREALGYYERLKPLLGNAATSEAAQSESEQKMAQARELIGKTIAKLTPPGDKDTPRHLWEYAEAQLQARGPDDAQAIAEEIFAGDTASAMLENDDDDQI